MQGKVALLAVEVAGQMRLGIEHRPEFMSVPIESAADQMLAFGQRGRARPIAGRALPDRAVLARVVPVSGPFEYTRYPFAETQAARQIGCDPRQLLLVFF